MYFVKTGGGGGGGGYESFDEIVSIRGLYVILIFDR